MELGTMADWVSAAGTVFAAVVALYLGGRDPRRLERRSEARQQIRSQALKSARMLQQFEVGLTGAMERSDDRRDGDDDSAASLFVEAARDLGSVRRWRVRRLVAWLYGRDRLRDADLLDVRRGEEWFRLALWKFSQPRRAKGQRLRSGPDLGHYHEALRSPVDWAAVRRVRRRFLLLARM
ncbi:hypothetical protein [Acidipropionibacterium acidipropionici]|uniref:hypothetical protein n=1 Tax=Acidipropionibacterium acidipropionici TaxID=1748 RepID=UPI00110BD9DC|nr:hypothetical protein [Acidipropionibacterium acidipropionici]QCV94312.1 hypothetical protein FEZ30_02680 [Acidipropionibacterium acidipropionici]